MDRNELLRTAAHYFRTGGLRTSSMQEMAEAMNVSRSSLYYHFTEKNDLFFEVLIGTTREFCDKAREIVSFPLSASQRFTILIRAVLKLQLESPALPFSLHLREERSTLTSQQRDAYLALRDEYDGLFRQLIVDGVEAGEYRSMDPKIVTFAILGMLEGFGVWFSPDGSLTSDDVADVFSDFVLSALCRDQPAGPAIDGKSTTRASTDDAALSQDLRTADRRE